jgi:hypothetical protein
MKKLLWAALLALPLLAWPAKANAFCFGNLQVDTGAKVWFNVRYGGHGFGFGMPQAGPWYLYWPMEAHFQTPAPGGSQFFPPPMGLPPAFGHPAQALGHPQPHYPPAPQGAPHAATPPRGPMTPPANAGWQAPTPYQPAAVPPTPYRPVGHWESVPGYWYAK